MIVSSTHVRFSTHLSILRRFKNEVYRSNEGTDAILEASIAVLPRFISAGLNQISVTTGQTNPVPGLLPRDVPSIGISFHNKGAFETIDVHSVY
jgi:hypothetical protein